VDDANARKRLCALPVAGGKNTSQNPARIVPVLHSIRASEFLSRQKANWCIHKNTVC